MGLKRLEGDEAMYYKKSLSGELEGIISTHVDDFSLAGKKWKMIDLDIQA